VLFFYFTVIHKACRPFKILEANEGRTSGEELPYFNQKAETVKFMFSAENEREFPRDDRNGNDDFRRSSAINNDYDSGNTDYENRDRDDSRIYNDSDNRKNAISDNDDQSRNTDDDARNNEDDPSNVYRNDRNNDNNDENISRDNVQQRENDGVDTENDSNDENRANNANSNDESGGEGNEAATERSKNDGPEMLKWNNDGKHAYGTVGHHKMPKAQKVLDKMLHEDKFLDGSSIRKSQYPTLMHAV